MWWKRINIWWFMLLLPAVAAGQQSLTLEELVDRALDENYQIRIMRNLQQMAENQNTLGNAGFLPSVGIRADQLWGIQNTEQRFFSGEVRSGDNARSTRRDAFIELDWVVFDGFRMFASRDRLNALARLGSADTRFYVEQTIADLAELYYQLIMEKQLLEMLQKSFQISAFRLQLESQKRNVGTGNALLYHQALIDYNADSSLILERERVLRELQFQVNYLTGNETGNRFQPALSAIDLSGIEEENVLLDIARENSIQLESALLEELIAESAIRMERAARYPQVSVFGNYSYAAQANEVGFLERSVAYGGQYGVRIRFSLYDGGRQNTAIRNAQLARENAMVASRDAGAGISLQIATLVNAYNTYLTRYRLLEKSLAAANSSLEIAREQLQEGFINGFDFRQAQLASINVENQMISLLYSLKITEIQIHRLTGTIHKLF
jgi:outer membrane protein